MIKVVVESYKYCDNSSILSFWKLCRNKNELMR